jgi:hypothetical protein
MSWTMSRFGLRQVVHLLVPAVTEHPFRGVAARLDAVARAARDQLGKPLARLFGEIDERQRKLVDGIFGAASERQPSMAAGGKAPGAGSPAPLVMATAPAARTLAVGGGRLDASRLVVLGDGLAAGMGDFSLHEEAQRGSFPAQLAARLQVELPQPLFQTPGLGGFAGSDRLPIQVPALTQTSVLSELAPAVPFRNLAIPGFGLADALERRPRAPLVHRRNAKQTAANLILGMPGLMRASAAPLATQLEAAVALQPTLAVAAFGYDEILAAALERDPGRLPTADAYRARSAQLFAALQQAGAGVVVAINIPDPLDSAGFSPIAEAARVLKIDADELLAAYDLAAGDRITVPGLFEIACQLLAGSLTPLPAAALLTAGCAQQIAGRVQQINTDLEVVARQHGVLMVDLHGLWRRLRAEGLTAGNSRLTADYLGGFYRLNGCYPGAAGNALIANLVLEVLRRCHGIEVPLIDVGAVASADPVASCRQAGGPDLRLSDLSRASRTAAGAGASASDAVWTGAARSQRETGRGEAAADRLRVERPHGPLQLPAALEQTLPLQETVSYHGDAIRVVHCMDDRDSRFGSCTGVLFGGLAMFDSQLRGSVRIKFTPPADNRTHFTVTHGEGLTGMDGMLSAPRLFRWPVLQARVEDVDGFVSEGELDLATGEVANLKYFVRYTNSALFALAQVNPAFPRQPIAFPGIYGSASARFDPRPDGKLDFTFHGSTFIPLGKELGGHPVRWALPFAGSAKQFASIPASGLALHPHLHLSTREADPAPASGECLGVPENSVRELTLYARNSSVGDLFTLNVPELGGTAKGRSQLMGRLQLQFGARFGDAVPVAFSLLPPGGLLLPGVPGPLDGAFPGRLPPGAVGHDEFLRFPLRSYFLDGIAFVDDPFDLSVGALDLRSGRLIHPLLHRGFIGQNLFYSLVRVEPRTPQSSFYFEGPVQFERGAQGQAILRYLAEVRVPFPDGFLFPAPDLATAFTVGAGSVLDPYLWIQAVADAEVAPEVMSGAAANLVSSTGQRFSYNYSISTDPGRADCAFEYVNHSLQATFRMYTLIWAGALHSRGAPAGHGRHDTVTFAGFGSWSRDPSDAPHLATVQISAPPGVPYASIQIDGGRVSNVNTKPENEDDALP